MFSIDQNFSSSCCGKKCQRPFPLFQREVYLLVCPPLLPWLEAPMLWYPYHAGHQYRFLKTAATSVSHHICAFLPYKVSPAILHWKVCFSLYFAEKYISAQSHSSSGTLLNDTFQLTRYFWLFQDPGLGDCCWSPVARFQVPDNLLRLFPIFLKIVDWIAAVPTHIIR